TNQVGWLDAVPGHDGRVPVSGPTFVHDLGLALWCEVIGLVADDRKYVELPRLQRRVFEEEQHHIAHRLRREVLLPLHVLPLLLEFCAHRLGRIYERIEVRFGVESCWGQWLGV